MLENVSVDVVDGARVKGVLGCPSVPGGREGVKRPRPAAHVRYGTTAFSFYISFALFGCVGSVTVRVFAL